VATVLCGGLLLSAVMAWALRDRSVRWRLHLQAAVGVGTLITLVHAAMPNPMVVALLSAIAIATGGCHRLARQQAGRPTRSGLPLGLTLALSVPAVFAALSWRFPAMPPIAPVGLGFFALRLMHLVFEARRARKPPAPLLDWIAYLFFMPTLLAGPLERFPRWRRQIETRVDVRHLSAGLELVVLGAFKKLVLADVLLKALLPPGSASADGFADLPWPVVVAACALRVLYVYAEFAGYTDMARGAARLCGIDLLPNFDRPLWRSNLAEFWRNWHISLSSFMRDHVFYPLLAATRRPAMAIMATMLAISAWHGLSAGWWLWGLHHALGLVLLATLQRRWLARPGFASVRSGMAWRGAGRLFTWFYLAAGSAFLWHPEDPVLGWSIYLKLWSLGWLS